MIKKIQSWRKEEGSALILFALMLVIFIGMAGLVIDVGLLYSTKSHLKKVSTAAALSGAQELTNSEASVNDVVKEILRAHGEEESLNELNMERENKYSLRVVLKKDVHLYFLRLFKVYSITVKAASSAVLNPMTRVQGAVPLGIDESIPLEYMKEYTLKVDSGESQYGNFGILALSGPGAKLYEHDLAYGYDGELKTGDIVDTQTGNIEGKTRDAINYRISQCQHTAFDLSHRDCKRVILILVYKPYNIEGNQLKQVKITGFAYFYIKSPMDKYDSSISGYFIKRAGNGYGDSQGLNRGAYAIKLTE